MIPSKQIGIVVLTNGARVELPEAIALTFLDDFEYGAPKKDYLTVAGEDFANLRNGVLKSSTNYSTEKPPSNPSPGGQPSSFVGTYENPYFGKLETDNVPPDGPKVEPVQKFTSRVPSGNSGLMFFDVTYTDPTQVPKLLAHAITLASPDGASETLGLTNPVSVGCVDLAILQPPLVGHGWMAAFGCCSVAAYHRDVIPSVNGILSTSTQFAIDYVQIRPEQRLLPRANPSPELMVGLWNPGPRRDARCSG